MKSKEFVLGNHLFYTEEEIKKIAGTNLNVSRALAAMEEYAGQDKWIPVEDLVPKDNGHGVTHEVICCNVNHPRNAFTASYDYSDGKWYEGREGIKVTVTHWQPKPVKPN